MGLIGVAATRRRLAALAAACAIATLVAACGGVVPTGDTPAAVVQSAMAKVAVKDLEGLRTLACAGQEDRIRDQLGLAGVGTGAELLPGVDTQALLDAITLDVSKVSFGEAAVDGDVATVPVAGSVKVTFDAAAMRPVLRQVLEQQGQTMSDEQLDALLKTLETYGQDVPVNESIRLVRENGSWKICQETLTPPATS